MPRVYQTYDIVSDGVGSMHPAAQTSTGTGVVITVTPPKSAVAFFITVETTTCRMTFDGTAPDATHGLLIPIAGQPLLIPLGASAIIKFASTAAANSTVQITFLA